jgi:hypothetical protein
MNILLKTLVNFTIPYLFKYEDIFKIKADKTKLKNMFKKAVKRGIIENIYEDIYKLKRDFIDEIYILKRNLKRKRVISLLFVSESALAQLIDPQCYISCEFALREWGWLNFGYQDCITTGENRKIDECWVTYFKFTNLYNKYIDAGITEWMEHGNKFRIAKPLRALCDIIYMKNLKLDSIEDIKNYFEYHIFSTLYEEFDELKKEDFDELQGKFGIIIIEEFLENIRRDLGL